MKFIKDWIVPLVIAVLIATGIKYLLLFKIHVPTESMVPTIMPNDQIFVTRIHSWTKLSRGDIIVFESDELKEVLVKRLIGLPGDKIEFNNGFVKINGVKYNDSFVKHRDGHTGSYSVPDNHYFFVGDNRPFSHDGRGWKQHYIPRDKLMGKAFLTVYPFNRFGLLKDK